MPATTGQQPGEGTEIFGGSDRSIITANETNQLKAGRGRLYSLEVWGVGAAWVIDVYDNASANANEVWQYVTADGKQVLKLDMPMANGIRVVTSGTTPGTAVVVWE